LDLRRAENQLKRSFGTYKEQQDLLGPQRNDIQQRNTDGHEVAIVALKQRIEALEEAAAKDKTAIEEKDERIDDLEALAAEPDAYVTSLLKDHDADVHWRDKEIEDLKRANKELEDLRRATSESAQMLQDRTADLEELLKGTQYGADCLLGERAIGTEKKGSGAAGEDAEIERLDRRV
jgi:DNA repair exonuclease SbcCD ATPase subunit